MLTATTSTRIIFWKSAYKIYTLPIIPGNIYDGGMFYKLILQFFMIQEVLWFRLSKVVFCLHLSIFCEPTTPEAFCFLLHDKQSSIESAGAIFFASLFMLKYNIKQWKRMEFSGRNHKNFIFSRLKQKKSVYDLKKNYYCLLFITFITPNEYNKITSSFFHF